LRFIFRLLAMIAVAIGVGFGASYFALTDGRLFGAAESGPWAAWPDIGQPAPNPYTRAYLSRTGILQLGYAEGIQFIAMTDSAGEPLERACSYRIAGMTPVSTFWTLVATTEDGANIAASPDMMAVHSDRLPRAADGTAEVYVSPRLAPGHWLETTGTGPFQLVITLYDATIFSGANTTIGAMPSITRQDCA
jgi:hypothetical protein